MAAEDEARCQVPWTVKAGQFMVGEAGLENEGLGGQGSARCGK